MTKKILVPLLVAPLILTGCGKGKKALKPFEKGDNLLTAEVVKTLAEEMKDEENKIALSEEKFTAPDGWKAPENDGAAKLAGFDVWDTTDAESVTTHHVVSLLANKEVASAKADATLDGYGFVKFTNLSFGYAWIRTLSGEGDNKVKTFKAVDAFGNTLVDWSGKEDDTTPVIEDVKRTLYEVYDFYFVKVLAYSDFHWEESYKLYAEDFSSLEDVEWFPPSGDSVERVATEWEKDGKTYYVDYDQDRHVFNIYQVVDGGDKLVKSFDLPAMETWMETSYGSEEYFLYSQDTVIIMTDRVVADDSDEYTYITKGEMYVEGMFGSSREEFVTDYDDTYTETGYHDGQSVEEGEMYFVLPGADEKHLQEVHVFDFYNMEYNVVASPYYIAGVQDLGLYYVDFEEGVLDNPFLFSATFYEPNANGYVDEYCVSKQFIIDDHFGLHDEMFYPQRALFNNKLVPFGDNLLDPAYGDLFDYNLKVVKSLDSDYDINYKTVDSKKVYDVFGDYAVVKSENVKKASYAYAIVDADLKLVTGFDFASVTNVDDTHYIVKDIRNIGTGYLDVAAGKITWVDMAHKTTDGIFDYFEKKVGEETKYDAYRNGIFFKEVASNDLCSGLIYTVDSPLGDYVKYGVKTLREGSTDVYDIVWYKIAGEVLAA